MRIRTRMLAFLGAVALAPLLAYGLLATHTGMRGAQNAVYIAARTVAQQAAGHLSQVVEGRLTSLRLIATGISRAGGPADPRIGHMLRDARLTDPSLRHLMVHDTDGRIMAATLGTEAHPDICRLAARVLETGEPLVTTVDTPATPLPSAALGVPIRKLDGTVGALTAVLDPVHLWSFVSGVQVGESGYAYVVDGSDHVFAHGLAPEIAQLVRSGEYPAPEIASEARAGRRAMGRYLRRDGVDVVGAAAVVPGTGWSVVVEMPSARAFASAHRLGGLLGLVLAFSVLGVAVVAWRGAHSLLQPIHELAEGIAKVGAGDFDARVRDDRVDELGDLARGFNAMTRDLGTLTVGIRRQERMAFLGRIASGLAHDMKKPFQHLITHVRTLLEFPDSARARANLERALDREQRYIDGLFTDLAAFADTEPRPTVPVEVAYLLRRVRDAVAPSAADAGVAVIVPDGELCGGARVCGDLVALERALRNLVENAVDALRDAGAGVVEIQVTPTQDEVEIVVADDGPGLPPGLGPELFEAFRTTKGSGRGLGLGLAVVRRIVEEHGGSIDAENGEVGARFVVRLPRAGTELRRAS